jgi:hypothetical protein
MGSEAVKRPLLKMIVWEDAFNGDHGWLEVADIPEVEPLLITTVGFEIRRDAHRVTLAMSYGDSRDKPTCCDLFTIPVGMIRKEKTLK